MVVRNPLDVIPSELALKHTLSHGLKLEYELHQDYPEYWHWQVKCIAKRMKKYFKTLFEQCRSKQHPVYIVRYEDLVQAPKDTLMGLMAFLLESNDLVGSNVERRID